MNFITILILSADSFFVLLLLSRLTGNRQISQLSSFDYVSSITIGSIAAELSTKLDGEWWPPLVAMMVYSALTVALALGSRKSIFLRRLINGKPIIIYQNGLLFKDGMRRARMNIDDVLLQARNRGYFDLQELQTIVQETNGQLSFLPRSRLRPVTPEDINLYPDKENLVVNLVLDGRLLPENLKAIGKDDAWFAKQIGAKGYCSAAQLLLVTYDCAGKLTVYPQGVHTTKPDLSL